MLVGSPRTAAVTVGTLQTCTVAKEIDFLLIVGKVGNEQIFTGVHVCIVRLFECKNLCRGQRSSPM